MFRQTVKRSSKNFPILIVEAGKSTNEENELFEPQWMYDEWLLCDSEMTKVLKIVLNPSLFICELNKKHFRVCLEVE